VGYFLGHPFLGTTATHFNNKGGLGKKKGVLKPQKGLGGFFFFSPEKGGPKGVF